LALRALGPAQAHDQAQRAREQHGRLDRLVGVVEDPDRVTAQHRIGLLANGEASATPRLDSAASATPRVPVATISQASGRQWGESRWPSGNSRKMKAGVPMVNASDQAPSQAAQSLPGTDPGAVTSA
jgi:hypothetical protein